jgi:allophanate hydrolase
LLEAAGLLYGGPWVAERLAAAKELWDSQPEAFYPVTRQVLATAEAHTAVGTFQALYRLEALRRSALKLWKSIDFLVAPTTVTVPTVEQTLADPLGVNTKLGQWTNFLNLLDCAGLAVPAKPSTDGRPFGITLIGPAGSDQLLFEAGELFEARASTPVHRKAGSTLLAVAGAHLRGLALNYQLLDREARFVGDALSAPVYRLYTFTDAAIRKPGMVRAETGGISVPLELWDLPEAAWGSFLALIPAPLGLGKVELLDGSRVTGFLMEASHIPWCTEITAYGGWRAYLSHLARGD